MAHLDKKPRATKAILDELKELNLRAKTSQDWGEINFFTQQYDWYDYPFYEGGKCGVKDVLGNVLVPARFDDYVTLFNYFSHCGATAMSLDGREMLVKTDGSGDVIPGTEYDEINSAEGSPFFEVWKGDVLGFVDSEGNVLVEPSCDQYYEFTNGAAAFHVKDGKWGVLFISGDVLKAEFDAVDMPEAGDWLHVQQGGKWGYVTEDGRFTTSEDEAYWGIPDMG